jgi:hypothetical protein
VLRELSVKASDDDQEALTLYFLAHPDRITLDYEATLFQSLHGVSPEDIVLYPGHPPNVRSLRTGSSPCILHGNGYGMETLRTILQRLDAMGWPADSFSDR